MLSLTQWLDHIGVLAVFALVLIEQVGLPLPTYPVLVIAGALSVQGRAPIAHIVSAAVAACLIADLGWYAGGRHFGSRVLRAMCRISLEPDSGVSDTEHLFTRFGTRLLLVAQFIPGLGAVATAMSGVVRVRLASFVAYDGLGATIWATTGVLLGAVFRDAVNDVFRELGALGRTGGLLILAILVVFVALKAGADISSFSSCGWTV